jgi:hypothetical protein
MNRGDLCALPRPAVLWVATGFCARTWYLRENHFQWEENPRRVYVLSQGSVDILITFYFLWVYI